MLVSIGERFEGVSNGVKKYALMRITCPVCEGGRVIKDPSGFWARLARAEAEAPGGRFDELTFYRYMMDHGIDVEAPDTWPVEEEACTACDDKGILETRTSWEDAEDPSRADVSELQATITCNCGESANGEADQELCECQ